VLTVYRTCARAVSSKERMAWCRSVWLNAASSVAFLDLMIFSTISAPFHEIKNNIDQIQTVLNINYLKLLNDHIFIHQ